MPRPLPSLFAAFVAALFAGAIFVSNAAAVAPPTYVSQWGTAGGGNGQFSSPMGIAVDGSGDVYVVDSANNRVQKFTANGVYLSQWGTAGAGNGQFSNPWGIAISGGTVYVADNGNNRVQVFTTAGAYVSQWGSFGSGNGQFKAPRCIAIDGGGDVYVTDGVLNRIQRFTSTGSYLLQWGATGAGIGLFTGLSGICIDGWGHVDVTDPGNYNIQQFTPVGAYTGGWGSFGVGLGQVNAPLGLATDGVDMFIVDTTNNRMQQWNTFGTPLCMWGSFGAGNGQFSSPRGAVVSGGFIYVADTGNHRVQKFAFPLVEECANCSTQPDPCCEALPTVGGPWSNIIVTTHQPPFYGDSTVVTIYNLLSTPAAVEDSNWASASASRYTGPGTGWHADSLGSVFGLTLDEYGNIFVCHTSCYQQDSLGSIFNGGAGAVYRIDGATGAMTTFVKLPNFVDPSITPASEAYPGLGNITYDCTHKQFFVTNLEDGKIYRVKAVGVNGPTGTVVETFDPLLADNGLPGWAPIGQRLWGVQWHRDRVYYSVWAVDPTAGTGPNEIRSIALLPGGGFATGTDQHELYLPAVPGQTWSMPVADISFSTTGKMLLGERGIQDKTDPYPHSARVLEYACSGSCWVPANHYLIGDLLPRSNAEGGVDYDPHPFGGPLSGIGRVWATGDAIHFTPPYTDIIYGFQGLRPNLAFGSIVTSMLVDADGDVTGQDKSNSGDVEAPGCVASTLGSICGYKFNDVNRNGIPNGTEPGLSGWTIVLNGPGGPYNAITDATGAFCFTGLSPGTYTMSEVGQPPWVQIAPPGGSFTINLAAGQNLTGYQFGNYTCALPTGGCVQPPPFMVAWWPFNESVVSTTASDVTHLSPARNVATLYGGAAISTGGKVARGICFPTEGAYARVPIGNQIATNWGASPFAIDAWVNPLPSGAPNRMIAEKRQLISPSPYRTLGWAIYLNGLQLFLELGNGVTTQTIPGPTITASTWTHVAVSVDRTPAAGRWYVNGAVAGAFNFVPIVSSMSNSADIYMGQVSPAFGGALGFQGCIDELQILSTPTPPTSVLPAVTVAAIAAAGGAGKCPEMLLMPSVTTICKNDTSVSVCFTICNNQPTAQSYHWTAAALPAGPGCTVAGPVTFSPAGGAVTIPPGTCSTAICVTMPRPAGLTAQNATACFSISFANDSTGACQTTNSTIRADNSCWCITPTQGGVVPVGARAAGTLGTGIVIGIKNPCPPFASPWRVSAQWPVADHADPLEVSLNGLPPGEPVTGTLEPDPAGGDQQITVYVSYPNGYDMAAPYEIVLEADTDGDGQMERQSGTMVASTYDEHETTAVPEESAMPTSIKLSLAPNPFLGSSAIEFALGRAEDVDLGIYDITGRRVRTMQHGRLAAGPHHLVWNGRDDGGRHAPAGVYFVRFHAPDRTIEAKIVKLQ